ncbi:MAG: transposase [Nostoc sp. CmiVER01]|uniref:transposase n=1 Tax=Nostoc sp. CmiVER01 TaxID=3075384 RepID=UPI003A0FDC09
MRVASDREPSPSEAIIDSQSVKSAALVSQAVGYDAGKKIKGRKRFLTVDTLGLVLRVLVTAASTGERAGGKQVLLKVKRMGTAVSRLNQVWVDSGFDGDPFMQWVMDFCRWIIQVVIRPKEHKGFVLLPKRWVQGSRFAGGSRGENCSKSFPPAPLPLRSSADHNACVSLADY